MARSDFSFCLNFLPDEPSETVLEWWQAAERGGVEWVGVADSPAIVRDTVVNWTYGAVKTERIGLMTAVTNPVSRDPSVLAGTLFALNELAPGRIACGIGTGDSAMWAVGLRAAKIAYFREYLLAVKALLRGEEADFEGRRWKASWRNFEPPVDVPLLVACAGPRVLRMAAQVADGMVVFMGFSEQNLAFVQQSIEEACAEIGRDPAELQVWWQTTINFAPTVEEAMERSLGVNTSWMTMGSLEGKMIPPELVEPLKKFNADMEEVSTTYGEGDRGRALVERAKEMGLHEFLVSMAPGFFGPPEVIAKRLREFGERGMTNWQFYVAPFHGERPWFIDTFVSGVLPLL
jgi:5,10-methylenetetrahydromethanopterin reductase